MRGRNLKAFCWRISGEPALEARTKAPAALNRLPKVAPVPVRQAPHLLGLVGLCNAQELLHAAECQSDDLIRQLSAAVLLCLLC